MKRHYNLGEQTFNQSSWGGKATKPTTFGGSLPLRLPEADVRRGGEDKVSSSKELSRWALGMMKEVATQLQKEVCTRKDASKSYSSKGWSLE